MLLAILFLYGMAGLAVAAIFALPGADRLLPVPAPISPGARILLMPGAFLLWPYLLVRMIGAAGRK